MTGLRLSLTTAALLTLSACAGIGLTPEQMQAMAGVSASLCVKAPGWNGSQVEVHYASFGGKATGTAGGGGKAQCGSSTAQFDNEGRAVAAPAARPASAAVQ